MNKVVTIHLCGTAFQLEEAGYDALRAYLDGAARRLEGNPDKDEIIADIEQAIADKCRAVLGAYKNVVVTQEVQQIIAEMGPVEDATAEGEESSTGRASSAAAGPASDADTPPRVRRLYKIHDGAMFAGVCNGIAAYFSIDPTIVRVLFVLFTVFWGFGLLVYIVLMFILPSPQSAAEEAAAYGAPSTAQEFIRRAKEGYYEGMRTWRDRRAHREWRRRFKRDMHAWSRRLEHEMKENAYRWRRHWQTKWSPPSCPPGPPPSFLVLIVLPVLALLRAALALAAFFAVISLLATHTVFGLAPPAGMPLWVALILLLVLISLVAWPLKVLRHAFYWHDRRGLVYAPPIFWFGDTIFGLGCLIVLLWFVDRHVPQAHEALQALPGVFHHAVDTVKQWWTAH